jgi:predicted acyl esterase
VARERHSHGSQGREEWLAKRVDEDPDEKCAAVHQRMSEGSDDDTGDYNAYWHQLDYRTGPVSKVRNVRASVFTVMGMQDRNVTADQFSTWWAGLPRGVQRKVWVTQYGHLDPFWARRDVWVDTLHKWFDHELMGISHDIMREPRADVQLGPDRWITQADWPARTRKVPLRPQHDGSLGRTPSTGTGSYLETRQTEAAMAGDPATTNPHRLAFLTPALKNAMRLSGTPSVSLRVKLDRPTANLGVLLVDYGHGTRIDGADPYGQGLKLIDGEDCVGESTGDAEPGTGTKVTVDLAPAAQRIRLCRPPGTGEPVAGSVFRRKVALRSEASNAGRRTAAENEIGRSGKLAGQRNRQDGDSAWPDGARWRGCTTSSCPTRRPRRRSPRSSRGTGFPAFSPVRTRTAAGW